MMIKLIKTLLLPFLLLLSLNVLAASADPNEEIVRQTITEYMEKNNIPGVAVELYVNGKPYSYYFGYADKDKKSPVTKKTIFELGSISKVMTSLLLAEEIDYSKMQLNDPVNKYIPDLPQAFNGVTLQSLATHTSGLTFNVPSSVETQDDLKDYLSDFSLPHAPNQQWVYSNFGIGMLGRAIETSSQKDIDQLYTKQILSPLGMQPIGTTVPKKLREFYAQGYNRNGEPVTTSFSRVFPSAGAMKASSSDMQRFLSAAIGLPGTPGKIFYPMRMTQTAYVKLPNLLQGLGWQIHPITPDSLGELLDVNVMESVRLGAVKVNEVIDKPTFDGNALIDKTGATDGFRTYIALIPNKKSGVVILTNRSAMDKEIVGVGREILFKLTRIIPNDSNKA